MSFVEGNNTFKVNVGQPIAELDGKMGSFIVLVWGTENAPSASFSISKNNVNCNHRRLTCVKDIDGVFIVPSIVEGNLVLGTSEDSSYTDFMVTILG